MNRTLFGDERGVGDDRGSGDGPGTAERRSARRTRRWPIACARRAWTTCSDRDEVVGERGYLRRAIAADRVPSIIFWGPPGSGKTTLAAIVARETRHRFVEFSAVTSGIRDVKQVMTDAARLRRADGSRTLLFVDEIHRFNRAQQDAFLPFVERGDIVLIGATTENPSFELNAALLSRCKVVVLGAARDRDPGADPPPRVGGPGPRPGRQKCARRRRRRSARSRNWPRATRAGRSTCWSWPSMTRSRGVPRRSPREPSARSPNARSCSTTSRVRSTSTSSRRSTSRCRESDVDAALYWLARMLAAGEDPLYVARRSIRFASEGRRAGGPGGASAGAPAWEAYRCLGSPEGELAVAQAVAYLALCPKSNALYRAYGRARRIVEERPAEPVPMALRNAPTALMRDTGYGEGYVYAHDTEDGVGGIQCLPDSVAGERFYEPGDAGFEAELGRRLERFRRLRERAAGHERPGSTGDP